MVWNPLFELERSQLLAQPVSIPFEELFSAPESFASFLVWFALTVTVISVTTTFLVILIEEDVVHSMV